MKKPINKIAVALWVVAGIASALNLAEIWTLCETLGKVSQEAGEPYLVVSTVTRVIGGMLVQVAILVALGAAIELLDQIRWDAKNRS